MLRKSVKAKRRHNKIFYELVRKIEVRRIDRTTSGNHYLISMPSLTIKDFTHHLEAAGEKKLRSFYEAMLESARTEAVSLKNVLKYNPGFKIENHFVWGQTTSSTLAQKHLDRLHPGELVTMMAHPSPHGPKTGFGVLDAIVRGTQYRNVPDRSQGEVELTESAIARMLVDPEAFHRSREVARKILAGHDGFAHRIEGKDQPQPLRKSRPLEIMKGLLDVGPAPFMYSVTPSRRQMSQTVDKQESND